MSAILLKSQYIDQSHPLQKQKASLPWKRRLDQAKGILIKVDILIPF